MSACTCSSCKDLDESNRENLESNLITKTEKSRMPTLTPEQMLRISQLAFAWYEKQSATNFSFYIINRHDELSLVYQAIHLAIVTQNKA